MRALMIAVCRMTSMALAIAFLHIDTLSAQTASEQATQTDTLTIDRVISEVVHHNDKIAAARFMRQAAEKRALTAGRWDDPMLKLGLVNVPTSFDFDDDPMTMKTIGLSQTIPYSGQNGLAQQAAKAEAAAALQDQYSTEVDLVMAAKIAYMDLYYRTKSMNDIGAQYDLFDEVIASAKSKLTTNQGSQAEVLSAQAEQWRLTTELYDIEHMVDEAQYALNILRGQEPITTIPPLAEPDSIEIPKLPDEWLDAAKQNYPALQKFTHQSEAYALSGASAKRMNWPTLELSADYGFRSGSSVDHTGAVMPFDDMVTFQASLSLPIFSRGRNNQMAESMEAMHKSSDAEALQTWREIEAKIRLLHLTAFHLQESITLYADNILPADDDAYHSALGGYTANKIPLTDLLNYLATIYKDRVILLQYRNQLARTMAEIESYINDPKLLSPDNTKN